MKVIATRNVSRAFRCPEASKYGASEAPADPIFIRLLTGLRARKLVRVADE